MEGGAVGVCNAAACQRPSIYPLNKNFSRAQGPAEAVLACNSGVVSVGIAPAGHRPSIYPLNNVFPGRPSPENAGASGVGLRRRCVRAPAR